MISLNNIHFHHHAPLMTKTAAPTQVGPISVSADAKSFLENIVVVGAKGGLRCEMIGKDPYLTVRDTQGHMVLVIQLNNGGSQPTALTVEKGRLKITFSNQDPVLVDRATLAEMAAGQIKEHEKSHH